MQHTTALDSTSVSDRTESAQKNEVTAPRLVIRHVNTFKRGRGRVKPRAAQMESVEDLKTLPRVQGKDLRCLNDTLDLSSPHDLATFHLLPGYMLQ